MVNSTTSLYSNETQMSIYPNKILENLKMTLSVGTMICFFLFLYFIAVILSVFLTSPHVREVPRYILFAHMLVNDTLYLAVSLFLLMAFLYLIYLPTSFCYFVITVATSTFRVTPYNLAAMALERYIAICYPFKHIEFCTAQKTKATIAVIWGISLVLNAIDYIAMSSSVNSNFFSLRVLCNRSTLTLNSLQNTIYSINLIISLTLVGLVIFYTYVRVMLVAFKIGSGKSIASKAAKTIMLHGFQLALYMVSLVSSFTLTGLADYSFLVSIVSYLLFMCFPRFLSPLIYGLGDELLRNRIRKLCSSFF